MSDITSLKAIKQPLSFLIQGPPGSGKTTFAAALAERLPKKTFFLDFDNKLAAQANLTDKQREKIDVWTPDESVDNKDLIEYEKIGTIPKQASTYIQAISLLNKLDNLPEFPYSLVVVDTGTTMFEQVERMILKLNNASKMEFAHWDNFSSNIAIFLKGLKKVPAMSMLNIHVKEEKDKLTGIVKTLPMLRGNKRYVLAQNFAEVYYFIGLDESVKGYAALVEGTQRFTARTGLPVSKPKALLSNLLDAIVKAQ